MKSQAALQAAGDFRSYSLGGGPWRRVALTALSCAEVPADRRVVNAQVGTDLHEGVTEVDGCCNAQWKL